MNKLSIDKHTDHLILDIKSGRIDRKYLEKNDWNLVNPEKLAHYFALTSNQFTSVKRIIHFVSGCIILSKNASLTNDKEVFHSLSLAKDLLEKTNQEIREMKIPNELKGHHQYMIESLYFLNEIFRRFVLVERAFDLNEKQIDLLLNLLKNSNEKLKRASSFEMGLEMVELGSSCACGH